MTPEQRWVYLNWLRDVTQGTDIGYVFTFYYGLERHLFFGEPEAAFRMVLRLREQHRHSSFLWYSARALLASCVLHKRGGLFAALLEHLAAHKELAVSDLFLLAKWSMGMELSAREVMHLASDVGFTNKRYLKDEEELFESELTRLLAERYGGSTVPLSLYSLRGAPLGPQMIAANYSLSEDQRTITVPCLTKHPEFVASMRELLQAAHDGVKGILKAARKDGTGLAVSKKRDTHPVKEPSAAYEGSLLFEAIDVHQFDKNAGCFRDGICPKCGSSIGKRPVQRGTCPACGALLLVKNSEFTGEKLLLTGEENERMSAIRTERARRNWIRQLIANYQWQEAVVAREVRKRNSTPEMVLLAYLQAQGDQHKHNGMLGLYRNTLLEMGQVYQRLGNHEETLKMFLAVCWLDLCGSMNSGPGRVRYDRSTAFLAPGVLRLIEQAARHLVLNPGELRSRFIAGASEHAEPGMPLTPDAAWRELEKGLAEAADSLQE